MCLTGAPIGPTTVAAPVVALTRASTGAPAPAGGNDAYKVPPRAMSRSASRVTSRPIGPTAVTMPPFGEFGVPSTLPIRTSEFVPASRPKSVVCVDVRLLRS